MQFYSLKMQFYQNKLRRHSSRIRKGDSNINIAIKGNNVIKVLINGKKSMSTLCQTDTEFHFFILALQDH